MKIDISKIFMPNEVQTESSNIQGDDLRHPSTSNGEITITFLSQSIGDSLYCHSICPDEEDCYYWRYVNIKKDDRVGHIVLIIENNNTESIRLEADDFLIIDIDGFVHKHIHLCDKYTRMTSNKALVMMPNTKTHVLLICPTLRVKIDRIVYKCNNPLTLNMSMADNKTLADAQNDIIIGLKQQIEDLKAEINEYKKQRLARSADTLVSPYMRKSDLINYEIIDDDSYWRIISKEEQSTISFNREFDKSKSNYNWINAGDPLITMKLDNVFGAYKTPTIIKADVSGIFEFNSNKMIRNGEEVCRIRKIPQCEKESTIADCEREAIKEEVLRKERKKMIERETLDELIAEGKVFNVITAKNGNRMTIPPDVASAVWNRDGGQCCSCGSKENLEFDHIIPLSKGGATTFRNLQLLCHTCNLKKSDNI